MPDITLCHGIACPIKDTCYRYILGKTPDCIADKYPEMLFQSWFMESPYDFEKGECEYRE